MVYTAVVFMCLFLLTLKSWRNVRFDSPTALVNGLGWGVTILFNPIFLAVLVGVLVIGGIRFVKISGHLYLRYAAVLAVTCGAVLAPWTIRNLRVLGSLTPIRDNFGLELYVSNNDKAKPTLADNLAPGGVMTVIHPFFNCTEAAQMKSEGELEYNREKMRSAFVWIRAHPKNFFKLSLMRFIYFWFTPYRPRAKAVGLGIMTVLGIVGGALMLQRERSVGILLFTVWIIYPLTFYFIQADGRYRYPIDWTFLLLAVYAIGHGTKGRKWSSNQSRCPSLIG